MRKRARLLMENAKVDGVAMRDYVASVDLSSMAEAEREVARRYLREFSTGRGHLYARNAAGLNAVELSRMRRGCDEFRKAHEAIRAALDEERRMVIEDTLYLSATGSAPMRKGYYPPSDRAAGMMLPVIDPRYRTQGAAQAVQINISV